MSSPASPVIDSAAVEPVMFSAPVDPRIRKVVRFVKLVRPERLKVSPAVAFTIRVSEPVGVSPRTLQVTPFSCEAEKMAVKPSPITTSLMFEKVAPVTFALPVNRIVLVPPPPSTVSPAETSEVTPE